MRAAAGDGAGALAAAEEAIRVLAPHFLRNPGWHARWMGLHLQNYAKMCEAEGRAPDRELLAPIEAAFQALQGDGPAD